MIYHHLNLSCSLRMAHGNQTDVHSE